MQDAIWKLYGEKKDDFIHHYDQVGGNGASGQLPLNVLQGGKIKQYTINFA